MSAAAAAGRGIATRQKAPLLLKIAAAGVMAVAAPLGGAVIAAGADAPAKETTAVAAAVATAATPAGAGRPGFAGDFVAVLLPPRMANLAARADRKVLGVRARAGQPVRAGDVIVAFDLREQREELEMARAQLEVARADAMRAGADLGAARGKASRRAASIEIQGRAVALVSGEEAAQARFEAAGARARARSAAAHVAEQRARISELTLSLEESELRAPFDGVVSMVSIEPGTTARAGEVLARVVGGAGLRARIAVPEEAAALLGARRARIAVGDRALLATIDHVTPEPEPASRAFIVEATVDGALDGGTGPGGCAAATAGTQGCAALAGRALRASLEAGP